MKKLILLCLVLCTMHGHAQVSLGKLKNKAKSAVSKNKKETGKEEAKPASSSSSNNEPVRQTGTTKSTTSSASKTASSPLADVSAFYKAKRSFIDRYMPNIANRQWTHEFMDDMETLDILALEKKMAEDESICGQFLMLYPKKLPTSGMGTITRNNVGNYKFARVAGPNDEPPASSEGKAILDFYKEYCLMKQEIIEGNTSIASMLRKSIQETESAHIRQRFNQAKLTKRQGEYAVMLLPNDERIKELKQESDRVYFATVEGFGNMLSGDYHKTHIQQISVFNTTPAFGSETASMEVETIIPGQTAYITGYFAMTNKDAGGIPSLLFINPENEYAKDKNPWGHGAEVIAGMFNGQNVKDSYYDKAYFSFNLFPDLNTVNYESHVQYIPHLNILKWLTYLPSEVVEIPVRYGRKEKVATGLIRIDLSGDNKTILKEYIDKLEAKRLASVTFPDLAGCKEMRSTVRNFDDLSKYGKVLKLTLTTKGDIMKPWPNDDEVDFNTAAGYAAVLLSSGKVEIMPLDFRKRPNESTWQWWSVGSFPGLYPLDEQGTKINAVKKIIHGYEILPDNVSKCGYWYTSNR